MIRSRNPAATMILTCYRHGLRASELCELRWSQVDWSRAHLYVKRLIRLLDHPRSLNQICLLERGQWTGWFRALVF